MTTQCVGQASYDLLQKPAEKINVIDMQREMQKSVLSELEDIINRHASYASHYYIVYILQRDRMMCNTIRQKFIVRKTRPFPDYDCSLFSYDNQKNELVFHWTIPDEETCQYLMNSKTELSSEDNILASYVDKFSSGTLV